MSFAMITLMHHYDLCGSRTLLVSVVWPFNI